MHIFLFRYGYLPTYTPGWLSISATPTSMIQTLELPWRDNKPGISCIPEGSYNLKQDHLSVTTPTYRVTHVPGRSGIRFDIANRLTELQGCIAVGTDLITLWNTPWMMWSRAAHHALMSALAGGGPHTLTVTYHRPININKSAYT